MWSRTASRGLVRRSLLARAGVVGLAVLASSALALPAATAAPAGTVTLAPADVELSLLPDQVTGTQPLASDVWGGGFTRVPVAHGGSVTFQLPAQLAPAPPALVASLALSPGDGSTPTRTYTSDNAVPADRLALTDLGGGQYRVDLPADDGLNGPAAQLTLSPLHPTVGPGTSFVDPAAWPLEFTASAPAAVTLTSQLIASSFLGCGPAPSNWRGCPTAATVTAGQTVAVTLPTTSTLVALGFPDLSRSAFALRAYDTRDEDPMRWQLEAVVSSDARTATVTVPAAFRPGRYLLSVGVGDSTGRLFSVSYTNVDVTAPAVNPGLRSETGGDHGSLLPVALGSAAALAVAGLAVRSRRTAARS